MLVVNHSISWVTVIWTMNASFCLFLAVIHYAVWSRQRKAGADTRDLAMAKGAAGFLQKPFSAESLLELLAQDANGADPC